MDVDRAYTKSEFCHSCLCYYDDVILHKFTIKNDLLKSVLQVGHLTLCQLCKHVVQNVELFVHNVAKAQSLFKFVDAIDMFTINSARKCIKPPVKLEKKSLLPIILLGSDEDPTTAITEYDYVVYETRPTIKTEVKQENGDASNADNDTIDDDDIQDETYSMPKDMDFDISIVKNEIQDSSVIVKDEVLQNASYSIVKNEELHSIFKRELEEKVKVKKKAKKRRKNKFKNSKLNRVVRLKNRKDTDKIEIVYLNKEDVMEERVKLANDEQYLSLPLKCSDCLKGFSFKSTYDKHMEKHDKNIGKYVCDICKYRSSTLDKLNKHKKYHMLRYKCLECNITRISRKSIKDHYTTCHTDDFQRHMCQYCPKAYKCLLSLRKHISYSHRGDTRVTCDFCQKTYANKTVLKTHLINQHSKETGVELPQKCHICQQCGKSFRAPSFLKKHLLKHTEQKNYYCVECDKSFKSDTILKHHLKTAIPHVTYADLPFPCKHCDKRFTIKRDVERHTNSIHLNVKPYQCDKCERAYVSKWSLKEHISLTHEGYKRPLRFPCNMCDKIFDRSQILKAHIRTHTGERPFQCSKCPANFSQSSILHTHVKLIHLKLTRDGKAKAR